MVRIQDKPRGEPEAKVKGGFDLSSLLGGKLSMEIHFREEDKKEILSLLKEISDKVDYRWKITQAIMVAAIILGGAGQVITWVM